MQQHPVEMIHLVLDDLRQKALEPPSAHRTVETLPLDGDETMPQRPEEPPGNRETPLVGMVRQRTPQHHRIHHHPDDLTGLEHEHPQRHPHLGRRQTHTVEQPHHREHPVHQHTQGIVEDPHRNRRYTQTRGRLDEKRTHRDSSPRRNTSPTASILTHTETSCPLPPPPHAAGNAGRRTTRTIRDMQHEATTRQSPLRRRIIGAAILAAFVSCAAPWNAQAHASSPGETGTPEENPSAPPATTPDTGEAGTPPTDTTPPERNSPAPGSSDQTRRTWRKVVVDLSEQELTVYDQHGKSILTWEISSGAPKTPTPVGRYRVTSKSRRTFATGNPAVTMEHMVRFKGGIGFHSIPRLRGNPFPTPLGERGVSHGCIRIADANARMLYRNLPYGALVIVKP